jgi:hypothetical protein
MSDLTIAELAALDGKGFIGQIKKRLRDDEAWIALLDPVLIERTRYSLNRMVGSIDAQKERAIREEGVPDPKWLKGMDLLRRYAKERLDSMAPPRAAVISGSREARAWKSFSVRLARALESGDLAAIDKLTTPYGGMTAREWLAAREEKREVVR